MSPTTKPARNIKVKVPRHNSQRLGPVLTAQVEAIAHNEHVRVDVRQTAYDPSSALAQAIESASEWNSLLLTARAERGPQWDIGTQQFLIEAYSDLYYDPTLLLEYQKEASSGDGEDSPSNANAATNERHPQDIPSTPQVQSRRVPNMPHPATHMPHHPQNPAQFFGGTPPNMASPRHPFPNPAQAMAAQGMGGQGMGFGNMGLNTPVSPAQFYGGGTDSPMRMGNLGMMQGGMGAMGMNMPGMGMGMHAGADGMSMGMGMGMNSPDPRRRLTRNMSGDDAFGGMHG